MPSVFSESPRFALSWPFLAQSSLPSQALDVFPLISLVDCSLGPYLQQANYVAKFCTAFLKKDDCPSKPQAPLKQANLMTYVIACRHDAIESLFFSRHYKKRYSDTLQHFLQAILCRNSRDWHTIELIPFDLDTVA